jgi:alkylated DNA repair dioxygenase AlkB
MQSLSLQTDLFGARPLAFSLAPSTIRHIDLGDGAWLDHAPSCLSGHAQLYDTLVGGVRWRHERREMYERTVLVPRALAFLPDDGPLPPVVVDLSRALSHHYESTLDHVMCAHYRTGQDSVAMHADKVRDRNRSLVAIVSLGAPRRFLIKRNDGARSLTFTLGMGDLLVMGGRTQAVTTHGVPKCAHAAPRMSVMFRRRDDVRFTPTGAAL